MLDLRGNGSYRVDRNEAGTTKLTGRTASAYAETRWQSLPRLFGSINWSKNVNDLELLGYDTRSRTLAGGASYSLKRLSLDYEYAESETRNAESSTSYLAYMHTGRADYGLSFAKNLVTLQTSYQISSQREERESPSLGSVLVQVLGRGGLYLDDASPEFDAMENAPALVDGITEIAAGDYNLFSGAAHNFGVDFGSPVKVDHLFLLVDTLEVATTTWSVWQSNDNLTWTPVATNMQGAFDRIFLRYEFSFPEVESRYLKLSLTPQLQVNAMNVTELRAFVTRFESGDMGSTTDHRGSARLQFQPSKWLVWGVSGDAVRQSESRLTLAREEDGLQAFASFSKFRVMETALRYSWGRSNYVDVGDEDLFSTSATAQVRSRWSRSLMTTAAVERASESSGNLQTRQNDRAKVEINATLLPALRASSQLAYSEDERESGADKLFSRSVTTTFEGEPTRRSQIIVSHRYETQSARVSAVRRYRASVSGRVNYQMSEMITMTASASRSEDPTRTDNSYDGLISWTPSKKWTVGGSYNRIDGSRGESSNQYSLQSTYYWTARTEISGSYSANERSGSETSFTSRVSLTTRF